MNYCNYRNYIILPTVSAMALLCLPSQAGAQDMGRNVSMDNARVASPATDPQGEIIVTARRRAEKLQDVPLAVSVMTQDQLKTQQVHDQNDLQQKIPSLSVDRKSTRLNSSH